MTFTPSVLSQIDSNNSKIVLSSTTYNGTYTTTTGYNALQISIYNTIVSGKLEIFFSPDGTTISKTLTDNYSGTDINQMFNKRYDILDKYYKISYTAAYATNFSITSRLCTDSLNSENNSFSAFDNSTEYTRDAFGKLRVTNPTTLLDIRFPYIPSTQTGNTTYLSNNTQISLYTSGAGSYTTTQNSNLILGSGTGVGYCVSQSRNYCTYLPGKSMLIKASCIMDAGFILTGSHNTNGVTSQVGYFDDNNGLYFEYTADGTGNGSTSINLKNNGVLSTDAQINWNIDPMNGNGSTGIKLDFTKAQLFVIDFEWLGVGRIRFGFYVYGKIVYCHEILNVNYLGSGPYMASSNLPIRYTIQSSTGQTGSMIQICSTVISEGGYNPIGRPFGIANTSGVSMSVGTEAPILAIRGGSNAGGIAPGNYYHQNIIPNLVNFLDTGNNNVFTYRIRLYRDGNLPGTTISWSDVDTNNSIVQYANATSITSFTSANSIVVNQGLFAGKASVTYGDLSNTFNSQVLQLTSNYNNQPDILVLTAELIIGSSPNVIADINWNEYI
jgi:hypothetical protein